MEKDIKTEYGSFISESPAVDFDVNDVPVNLRHLIPYARFWGISDDLERERLAEKAPEHIKSSLKELIRDNDDSLDDWLAGEEASYPDPSDAYVAFSAMRMAADFM
ncbi:hypothetical protein [Luteolibacter luteus]|uniref:Uncharacterized protein n=1 Tax=Luteolibacter luteus TaxID=2728835 RepID=A0A858RGP0_9BACT|nr:hypothetical protein [Luteolibacter luteus]QJE95751.1 hypothetical protein HHL09_08120 [Luteolibacter luteus]